MDFKLIEKMKNIILTIAFVSCSLLGFSQAKKPTIMVIPSDTWCNENGYVKTFDNQGYEEKLPDYEKAVFESSDLNLVISKIGEMMIQREFPLKDLASTLKAIKQQAIEESVTISNSGDIVAETPLEKISKVAKSDIVILLSWKINKLGPQKSITFSLQGIDAYTNKQVASASGTGRTSSSTELAIMLEDAVLSHIDQFNLQLQSHFDDMFANGREVSLLCKRWSDSDLDFESEVNGDELGILIEDWVAENSEQGRFSTDEYSQNVLSFGQVRIPMFNEKGRAIDTRRWAYELNKYLRNELNIESKLTTKGLGQAVITIGGK